MKTKLIYIAIAIFCGTIGFYTTLKGFENLSQDQYFWASLKFSLGMLNLKASIMNYKWSCK